MVYLSASSPDLQAFGFGRQLSSRLQGFSVCRFLHMDYIARQLIFLSEKLRKALGELNVALHEQTEAISRSNKASDAKQSPPPEVTTNVNIPDSIEIHQNAPDTLAEQKYRNRTLFVSSLTLAAIVVYAVLVYFQWQEMNFANNVSTSQFRVARQQFQGANKNFRLDERASISPIFPPKQTGEGPTVGGTWVSVSIENTGKTDARNVHGLFIVTTVEKGGDLGFDYKEAYPVDLGFFPPGLTNHYGIPLTRLLPDGKRGGMVLSGVTDQIRSGDLYIFGYGKLKYQDIFGEEIHYVKFCQLLEGSFVSPTTAGFGSDPLLQRCNKYNRRNDDTISITSSQ
jgi:hypothetical protein